MHIEICADIYTAINIAKKRAVHCHARESYPSISWACYLAKQPHTRIPTLEDVLHSANGVSILRNY